MSSLPIVIVLAFFDRAVPVLVKCMNQLQDEQEEETQAWRWTSTLVGTALTVWGGLKFGCFGAILISVVWAIQWIDIKTHLIPESLQIIGAVMALTIARQQGFFWQWHLALAFAVVAALAALGWSFEKFTGKPAMGFGDIKYIGWLTLLGGEIILAYMVGLSALLACFLLFGSYRQREHAFPFAPTLTLSAIAYLGGLAFG